ncbi:MAG: hypothetical protein ABS04_07690 [Pelagibacteraceae bacterium BACL5 MAG-121015-bin10]|nr:MAG: hypothetical protein ABS04_07690 [Pelagibacteraceae bacterium BACL5 MAG-121015-bin10]
MINFSSLIEKVSIIDLISFKDTLLIVLRSLDFKIVFINLLKAISNPSSRTSSLLKFISNFVEISTLLILKPFAYKLVVEKKNLIKASKRKNIYRFE